MKIIICGNYGVSNVGDEAILEGLTALLLRVYPGATITVMGQGKLLPLGVRSVLTSIFRQKLWREPMNEIKSCDLFVLGGGGLFTDEEGPFVSLFWALHGLVAHRYKKKVICLGLSVSSVRKYNEPFVRKCLASAALVTVRDSESEKLLKKWGIKAFNTSDLALLLPQPKIKHTTEGRKYVVVSIRYFKNINDNVYKIFAQFCDLVITKYGLDIRLIPFQKNSEFDGYHLYKIFEQIKHKTHAFVGPFYEESAPLLEVLAGAEVVIATRLHAGILSLLAGTPFIPISYMSKIANFWKDYSFIPNITLKQLRSGELTSSFEKLISNRDTYRSAVARLRSKLVASASLSEELLKSI